jgi:lipopolysaccharide/colanic/teichoic acid biosynthesis glycosyltransferase
MITFRPTAVESQARATPSMYEATRRMADVVIASVALALLAIPLLIFALAVAITTRAWPIFSHERVGRGGQLFRMYKLKSMIDDRRRGERPIHFEERRQRHKSRVDPRVTRLGRFLRRTAVDELPQLWNVLVGDMSIVGPRPELPNIVSKYEGWQHRRHAVRPGLTGWWQVMGPADQLMHEHVEYDLYYVDNRCWTLDLRIIWRTFSVLLNGRGRY